MPPERGTARGAADTASCSRALGLARSSSQWGSTGGWGGRCQEN